MQIPPSTDSAPRVRLSALLSAAEADALQNLLDKLTTDDFHRLAEGDEEITIYVEATNKIRRQLGAAEEIPVLPAYDD